MTAEEYIRAGDLDGALSTLREAIKKDPADSKLRVFLFQLLSVNGDWEKALTQLNLIADISPDSMLLAQIFRPVIQCEALRAEVFAGKRSPLIFGEPQEWIGLLVHANSLAVSGNLREAREVIDRALEAAPAVSGSLNQHDFEWIADADSRLGPVLEAVIDGKVLLGSLQSHRANRHFPAIRPPGFGVDLGDVYLGKWRGEFRLDSRALRRKRIIARQRDTLVQENGLGGRRRGFLLRQRAESVRDRCGRISAARNVDGEI